jgi:hypothetical protein
VFHLNSSCPFMIFSSFLKSIDSNLEFVVVSSLPDVMPVFFEGAKLMVNKGLSNHFQVSHTINLCSSAPSGYRFGATYVGTKQFGPSEAFPVILGDIDPSGNLNANIIHQFAPNIRCKFASQVRKSSGKVEKYDSDEIFLVFRSNRTNSRQHN